MKYILDFTAEEVGITNPSLAVIEGVEILNETNELDADIDKLIESINKNDLTATKESLGFNELFKNMGYESITPAGTRLVNSFKSNGFKKFNNIVDSYNIISATYASGIGMHDLASIPKNSKIHITLSMGGDRITPMFKDKGKNIKSGDLIYSTNEGVIAWLGKRDVDSDKHKVTSETNSVLLVVLGNKNTSQDFNNTICKEIFQLIKKSCPLADMRFLERDLVSPCHR